MDRRRFLAGGLSALGAGLVLGRSSRLLAQDAPPLPDLAVASGAAKAAVGLALDALGGMGRFVKPGQVVVIKPNASFEAPPAWGATTHPDVLAAVIGLALAAGARRVIVADHTMGDAERCFQRTGTTAAVAAFPKAKLVSLDDETAYAAIDVPAGRALHATKVPVLVQKADVLINLPKAKSHAATGVSLGMKNLMGLVWDRHVFHASMDIHQGIADLATVLRPALTVLDATVVLKTGGPNGPGETESPGKIVAGIDPVAVDAYGAGLCTWNQRIYTPEQVDFIRHAAEMGLGTCKLDALRIARVG
jgi:uncharacterized protein (DUF362 family)